MFSHAQRDSTRTESARPQYRRIAHGRVERRSTFLWMRSLPAVIHQRTKNREPSDPQLFVIGAYAMGIEISAEGTGSRLRVFIDCDLPIGRVTHWLGVCSAGLYARWCVTQMLNDATRHFHGIAVGTAY